MADPTVTQGLTALLTPLATVGAGVYTAQTKQQINQARIKAGKEPCTGLPGQPADCPSIFATAPAGAADSAGSSGSSGESYTPQAKTNPWLIVGLLVGAGVVVMLLLPKKKPTTPAARRRKRK